MRVPLVVGVTGHRDLRPEDESCLRAEIESVFVEIEGHASGQPLVLLSALAEGADCLVAEIALDRGARLQVPLPLPLREYEKDFHDRSARMRLGALLDRAEQVFEVSIPGVGDAVSELPAARTTCYAASGAYIVRNSQVLIALWDGERVEAPGGTGEVVEWALHGIPEPFAPAQRPLDALEQRIVYQVVTPRRSSPNGAAPTIERKILFGSWLALAAVHSR